MTVHEDVNAASGTHTNAEAVESPDRLRSQEDATARRLTPTERLHEVTMAAMSRRPAEPEHTVGLTLNAKGEVQIEVTGRGPDLDELTAHVVAKFQWLRATFPRGGEA